MHPGYSGNNLSNDVAVILLDRAVKNIEPVTIAELGLLDEMKADASLAETTITNVGLAARGPTSVGPRRSIATGAVGCPRRR